MIGEFLGSYRLCAQIGSGGMGVVYAAEHPTLGRRAAVKILRPELSADREIVKRFFNEARAATLIKHPGIVAVFDFGTHRSGSAFLVMEYLEGQSLWALLRREGRLPVDRIIAIGRQIASALAAAHAAGIVHRDLKPANLFLVADPDLPLGLRVKVLDFGVAKLSGDGGMQLVSLPSTAAGRLLGTPAYMAPEQCRGAGVVDARADIYALGCILFQMAAGRPPFERGSVAEMLTAHLTEAPPRIGELRLDLPVALARLIEACLEKAPQARPKGMQQIVATLDILPPALPAPSVSLTAVTMPPTMPTISAGPHSVTLTSNQSRRIRVVASARHLARLWPWAALAALVLGALAATAWWVAAGDPVLEQKPAAQVVIDAGLIEQATAPLPPPPPPDASVVIDASPPPPPVAAPRPSRKLRLTPPPQRPIVRDEFLPVPD